jgi:hypothetical protein
MGEERRWMFRAFGAVFVCLSLTALATVSADELTDSHSRTDKLERDFGIRVLIPDTWVDPPSAVVMAKETLFGYVKLLPTIQKNQQGHIEIRIERTPTIRGRSFVCGIADLREDFTKQLNEANKQPLDFATGVPSGMPKVGVNFFRGVEPPPLSSSQDDPLSNFPSSESAEESVFACSATTAYVTGGEAESSQFVRAITRAFSTFYVITVVLEVSPALYTTFAPDYSAVVESISFRCGKEGQQWCAAVGSRAP